MGVAAYGVIANLSLVVISIFTGIAQGMQPLISSAYGRGDSARIRGILRYGLAAAVFISLTLYAGICWGAAPITAVFNSENNLKLQEIAEYGLRLYFTGIPAAGLNIILSIFFTSTEQAVPAHIISLLRGLVLIIPIAFFLAGLHVSLYRVWRHLPVHAVSPPADRFLPLPWVRPGSSTVPVPCPSSAPYHTGPGHLEMLRC